MRNTQRNPGPHYAHYPVLWEDRDYIELRFTFLIINLQFISEQYGCLREFDIMHRVTGSTNGRLWWLMEMRMPPGVLIYFDREKLQPLGMEKGRDYVFVTEIRFDQRSAEEKNRLIGGPHPDLISVPWLGSIINEDGQQYLWWEPPLRPDLELRGLGYSSLHKPL